jgi:hypothetical protein
MPVMVTPRIAMMNESVGLHQRALPDEGKP